MPSSAREVRSAGEPGASDGGEILPAASELPLTQLLKGVIASLHFL